MKARRDKILNYARNLGYNAIAAFEPQNVFYLTGFWGEAIAICTPEFTKLIAPKLEVSRAEKASVDCEVIPTERGQELLSTFASLLPRTGRTCTDLADCETLDSIRKQLTDSETMQSDTLPFYEARKIKDQAEIDIISDASKILDKLFSFCTQEIKIGLSERALQAMLVFEGLKMGANPPSYKSTLNPLIIAGGPNGALPHAEVSDRKFRKGDMIVVDLTLRHKGYIADATRTFLLGSETKRIREVYDIVLQSQKLGLQSVKPGKSCGDVDSECRRVISDAGYAKEFIHATGHGIGLDVHEPPWLRSGNPDLLQGNMTVTVEPGIYLQGKFGVRIEDSVLVTASTPKILNKFSKDLISI